MRFIKLGLFSIFFFFLAITAISLLFPAHMRISRAVNIAAPHDRIYKTIGELKTWDQWNRFIDSTPLTGKSFSSPSAGKGAFFRSDQLKITLTDCQRDSIKMHWDQTNGRSFDGGFNLLQLYPDSLTVQWYFDFHFKWYPWEKFGGLVYDKKLGTVMEESLNGLKRFVENSP